MSDTAVSNNLKGKSGGVAKATPSLDPRTPSLVQPYKRLVEEGFITRLEVVFTPTGANATCQVDARVVACGSGIALATSYPVGMIARLADEKNLIPKKGKKSGVAVPQPLPKKSLVVEDFETDEKLVGRSRSVAEAIGGGGLMGRIGSAGMLPNRTMPFADWWKEATSVDRLQLLTTKDKREAITAKVDASLLSERLSSLACPFRDTLEIRVAEVDEEEEEKEQEKPAPPPQPASKHGKGSSKPKAK